MKLTALAFVFTMLASFAQATTLKVPTVVEYETVGVASSYGPERQGKETSSGELFDWRKLTAAHRTLPFGSIVRVTNLANGRSVQVRINDRGPGWRSRIIDLSDGAARRLRFDGLTRVRLKVLRYGRMTTDYSRLVLYCGKGHSLCSSKLQPVGPDTDVAMGDSSNLEHKATLVLKNGDSQIHDWAWIEKADGTTIRALWQPRHETLDEVNGQIAARPAAPEFRGTTDAAQRPAKLAAWLPANPTTESSASLIARTLPNPGRF